MPANPRSLRVTDAYRERLRRLQVQAQRVAASWRVSPDAIDETGAAWLALAVPALEVLQRAGASLASGYAAAYVASELNRPAEQPPVDDSGVGESEDGQPLAKAIAAAFVTVGLALRDGKEADVALREGQNRATRIMVTASAAAPRRALHSVIETDDRLLGWRRVTFGGCGACLADASGKVNPPDEPLHIHPWCRCVAEPVVADVPERAQRPTGIEIFDAMPEDEQDALLGHEKASLIRSGAVAFERLIQPQPMVITTDGITEAPLSALLP